MQDKVDQIVPRFLLGDGVVAVLEQIDDPDVARHLTDRLWAGIPGPDTTADANASDLTNTPRNTTSTDHDVVTTPVEDLEREAVVDRLIDANVIHPPDGRIYDVDHDVAADAYRVGRRDAAHHNDVGD